MTQHRVTSRVRRALLIGASLTTLGAGLSAAPVAAQSARGALALRINTPRPTPQGAVGAPVRSPSARAALQRQVLTTSRTEQIRAYVTAARAAAAATNRAPVGEGLSPTGLQPTAIVGEAMAAIKAGDTARATQLLVAARAVNDPTGTATWEGARAPVEQAQADGRILVSIDQTQERALLSWNSFNVGERTTLQFNQKANGVAQPGWVAVNRVTNSTAPSQILGNLKADGTVVVVNPRGVIFGRNAQVNTQSLLASTLDIGYNVVRQGVQNRATTIADRNNAFLNGGLFLPATVATNGTQLLVSGLAQGNGTTFLNEVEGDVVVDAGAQLTTAAGGFLMLAAPRIESAGILNATDGQVSLQAGRAISYVASGGGASDPDPNLRGYRLGSYDITGAVLPDAPRAPEPADGHIEVRGLVQSRRGYLSLGTDFLGSVEVEGMLASTTSVSRNGKIAITGGTITLAGNADPARAAAIEILPDTNGETIPQGSANAPASFKASQIEVGALIGPTNVTVGQNAVIHAPNADVRIGLLSATSTGTESPLDQRPINVTVEAGAIIDVAGIKDVQLDASRNQIQITPVKRNELRDTPNYREVVLDGNFTLNGTTLYVDPRVSGVRADGVAWVGSPLIEAGSLASQISAGAAEFMTRGGTVSLLSNPANTVADPGAAPAVRLSAGATVDVSGGWVSYAAGPVRTSRLLTNDGRVVDIARANPNDVYVGVAEGFSEVQPRFGVVRAYLNAGARGVTLDAAYDEGRDAGALTVFAPAVSVEGTVYGNAFAGTRQVASGGRGTRGSAVAGDTRLLQASPYQLPAGAALSIGTQGDVRLDRAGATATAGELLLGDGMLNDAGLSQLRLTASGNVVFADASQLTLAPGGALVVDAGLAVRFDGSVAAPAGQIVARTSLTPVTAGLGSALATFVNGGGSIFAAGVEVAPLDITVTGTLSAAGLWSNDFTAGDARTGGAFSDGGTISLTTQPRFFQLGEDGASAIDRSGSIRVGGTLDVSAGGFVTLEGGLVLDGAGGDVALVNATVYARTGLTANGLLTDTGLLTGPGGFQSAQPIGGSNQTVDFTPLPGGALSDPLVPQLVPDPQSVVDIAGATIRGFGFAQGGGGTFQLISPDLSFGSDVRAGSTHIGLDFLQRTGFGTLDLSTTRSRIVADLFTNDSARNSAFLETTRLTIGAGETLDLTQWVRPSIVNAAQTALLRGLGTGANLADVAAIAAIVPQAAFDRRAANLVVGGLAELDVLAGGSITGAAGASVTAAKLYNAGTIRLHGGTVAQAGAIPGALQETGLGVRDIGLGGAGLADALGGAVDAQGRFDEAATNAAGVTTGGAGGRLLTNAELFTRDGVDRLVYFLGLLDQGQGIVLAPGSVTDLSGTALFDPRAQVGTARVRAGRVLDGGSIRTSAALLAQARFGQVAGTLARTLERDDAAAVDIGGTSAVFDQALSGGRTADYLEWSAAGTIAALGGGTLGTTPIAARGGVAQAQGGTLEWLRPTIGTGDGATPDYLSVGTIAASGFDALVARGSARLDGAFDLSLRKSFAVTSQDATGDPQRTEAYVGVSASEGTRASVTAGHVRFASILEIAGASFAPAGDAAVAFAATQGIDVAGGVLFDRSIADLTLRTAGDVRLIGVDSPLNANLQAQYDGQLVAGGNLTIDARRTYATTGTGNLQALLEGQPERQTNAFDILALDGNAITFGNTYLDRAAAAPLSAGTHLRVLARTIVQNGWLAAPLGLLEIGGNQPQQAFPGNYASTPTESVTFGAGSVTSVSGAGLLVPYGTTTDGIEYFFPTIGTPITRVPTAELRLAGGTIDVAAGALVDGRGGGDVFGYEFQSGVGGSRDVLDRFNNDAFSSNAFDAATGRGYQFADRRQVFALVPLDQANRLAAVDPVYSADYGAAGPVDLYGAAAGRTVRLEGGAGVAAGDYLLLPARYARSVPGALRLVENTDVAAPLPGATQRLLDGSVVVAGTFGYAGSGLAESTRRSFTVQSRDVFLRYSQIATTSGAQTVVAQAAKLGNDRPRVALDAARVILSPLESLRVAGAFETGAATGGRGGEFDVLGADIAIAATQGEATPGVLTLTADTLTRLNAASLLIGGQRSETATGATALAATAGTITIGEGATLSAPELLFAVTGTDARITVADGAVLRGTGALENQSGADYLTDGAGALLRLANGPERLVTRSGAGTGAAIEIGAATLAGGSLALDTSGDFAIGDAVLDVDRVAISGRTIAFAEREEGVAGRIDAALEARLAAADRLTVRAGEAIRFAGGAHRFNALVLDAGGIAAMPGTADAVTITAGDVRVQNTRGVAGGCATLGSCGAGALTLDTATLSFGAGAFDVGSFTGGVTLGARAGMYVEGKGTLAAGDAALTLATPFLVDRGVADPREQVVRPDYGFLTGGAVAIVGTGAAAAPVGAGAPGARIAIGSDDAPVASVRVENALVRATAGIIDVHARGDVTLAGATLATPGYERTFGDAVDAVTVSAGAGTVNLVSREGDLSADAASAFVTDTGVGRAGTLNLLAGRGTLTLAARINAGVRDALGTTGTREGSLTLDSGTGVLDLGALATDHARLFGGEVAIRSGAGDLTLAAGQAWRARSIALTADGGAVTIAGTLDTSGVDIAGLSAEQARDARVNGGDIALWGAGGVTLATTARLDTHTGGYADGDTRAATAGDVSIGIGRADAALTIASGATIDVGARRTQADGAGVGRLVPQVLTDPATGAAITVYRYAEPDSGGTVRLRAPVIGAGDDRVAVSLHGAIAGADSVQLEAFKRWDLDALADSALYAGVTRGADGAVVLDMAQGSGTSGLLNPLTQDGTLADGSASVVRFIRDFGVTSADGSSLAGVRVRPGIDLSAAGAIRTESQWNLAAATFSQAQLDAAVARGDLRVIPELGTDTPRYAVVAGREASLLENSATFLYRVGGSARGEAPVVTLRAGGDLTVNRSISDGFFTFRDKSDPAYLNYQLGGGDRVVAPAISFSCGFTGGNCAFIPGYAEGIANPPGAGGTIAIGLGSTAQRGEQQNGAPFVNSPLPVAGNGAAGAVDEQGVPTGDVFGFAELFPLLSDGAAMHSSDIRLVGGAGAVPSADPLRVDRASDADVRVQGEFSYRIQASGTLTYGGALQLRYQVQGGGDPVVFDLEEALSLDTDVGGLDALRDDAYTTISWGAGTTALATEARAAALAYFAGSGYQFTGSATRQSGITAPLSAVLGFLQSFEPTYLSGIAAGRTGYNVTRTPSVIDFGDNDTAYVRTAIRTGDGAIHVAAARDADLRGGTEPVYRTVTGQPTDADGGAQFAAAAIYTAGVRAAAAPVTARIAGTATRVTVTPDSPYLQVQPERLDFIPSPLALSDTAAVLTRGGGDVTVAAGRDVLGRRDVWSEQSLDQAAALAYDEDVTFIASTVGQFTQRWRTGSVGADTEAGLLPRWFNGVGALSGGDVAIRAGRDVTELTVALDSALTTTTASAAPTLLTLGRGDLTLTAGRDIRAGRVDVASGAARIEAGRDIAALGLEPLAGGTPLPQYMRVRLADARVAMRAGGAATLASVSALGVDAALGQTPGSAGFFSPSAAFTLAANEAVSIVQTPTRLDLDRSPVREYGQQPGFQAVDAPPSNYVQVLPPSFGLTSLLGSVVLPAAQRQFLYPSPIGQLRLFSAGDIAGLSLIMSDADPSVLGGAFVEPVSAAVTYRIPFVAANTDDAALREQHNRRPTHLGDAEPVRIHSGGDILSSALFLPKQARITAAGDIVDMFFNGQNLDAADVTRIRAGGDIRGTTGVGLLPFIQSNNFVLGGPGTLIVEAGRDLGPFVTSADILGVQDAVRGQSFSNAGGIRTVGNEYNPWLEPDGANLEVRFGMAAGADYDALREIYLNPANLARLDGDLFEQVTDAFGNTSPDRTRPIYAPALARWLRDRAPEAFATVFGEQAFADDGALAAASYGRFDALYAAFAALPALRQQGFLVNQLYFNELAAAGLPDGPSYLQYVRGYRAVQALFPTRLGYTDNLAPYTLDPATVSADHPLGEPVRNIVDGQPQRAVRIDTGSVDLRLSTLQTARGGDVTILGPGGTVIAGSIVRTAEQPLRRQTAFEAPRTDVPPGLISGALTAQPGSFTGVPLGFEGVLTLRGGAVRAFTDGDFILNQSRVFTQAGGDVTMWSSNGDLNAGQGPKSAANFPPVTVRFDENGLAEVSSAGSVAGAGIGAFQRTPDDPPSDVVLIAPVGEVDAGDAGVRASGNIVVAAARVANADNFSAAGDITGVPSGAVTASIATPASAASAIAANAAVAARADDNAGNRRSLITVDVLGPAGGDGRCDDPRRSDDPNCR